MNKEKIGKGLVDIVTTYFESDRKNYDVRVRVVLDKKNPTNLEKAYLVVMFRNPWKFYVDKDGVRKLDKKWHFSFRTSTKCLELKHFTDYTREGWFKTKPVTRYNIGWKLNSKEQEKFNDFASNHKVCRKIIDEYNKATKIATGRYFEALKKKEVC